MTWGRFSVEQMPAVDRHVPAGPADLPPIRGTGRSCSITSLGTTASAGLHGCRRIVMRCAATLPAAKVPAAIVVSRRAETRAQVTGPELFKGPGRPAETHQVEEQL